MKKAIIKIIYDNTKENDEMQEGWGFSALIETDHRKLLFDTGNDLNAFFSNTKKMNIDLKEITDAVFSHKHADHTAGCREILEKLKKDCQVYLPKGFPVKLVPQDLQIHEVVDFQQIHDGIFSMVLKGGFFFYEQVLLLNTPKGLVVVTGCAHPGILHIVQSAQNKLNVPIHLVLGGFHLFRKNRKMTEQIVRELQNIGVKKVAPCHCTGASTIEQFKEAFQQNFLRIGTGSVFSVL